MALVPPIDPPALVTPAQADTSDPSIRAFAEGLVSAWNAHDAKAFSANFMEDGSFANILGMTSFTKDGFLLQHERIFAGIYRESRLAMTVDRVKMLKPDVALVDATTVLRGASQVPPGIQTDPDGAIHTKLEMVLVKKADGWWMAAFHNVAVGAGMPPGR